LATTLDEHIEHDEEGRGDLRTRNLLVGSCEISEAYNISLSDPSLGDSYCDDYAPYSTEECCWDGGDCKIVFGDCVTTSETCPEHINSVGNR